MVENTSVRPRVAPLSWARELRVELARLKHDLDSLELRDGDLMLGFDRHHHLWQVTMRRWSAGERAIARA
jgi:hypothetical protein